MDEILKYNLIGIGEFSHGIRESWEFRFDLLKFAMKNTNKKIDIYVEHSIWMANNIMNNTIWSRELNKPIKYDGFKIEKPVELKESSSWGKLWQYMNHSSESKILFKIIKYIRKNKDRINFIGLDNDTLDRDYYMYKIIIKNLNKNNINFFWAHNHHVNDQQLEMSSYKYIKNKDHKWYCGHYLKKKLKDKYCIILSQAYQGENRFNGYCSKDDCSTRSWQLQYIYKKFKYSKLKKYVDKNKKYQLLTEFNEPLIAFSNSYFNGNKYGLQGFDKTNKWNYILFWNKVTRLEPYYEY